MLLSLSIRDFVLIEKLDLDLARGPDGGLGALTGETGAGKSILIDALGLALGARAETAAVRRGATQASVAASFELAKDHAAHAILAEQGLDDDDVLTLRRMIGADGRGRAFVNDQPASVALLRRLGDTLVEIQGQMEQHGLLDVATHRASLDAFAGLEKQAASVRAAWQAWRGAERARAEAEATAADARRDEEFLRHAVKELKALAPKRRRRGEAGGGAADAARRRRARRSGRPRRWASWRRAAARSQPCAPRTVWSSAASTRHPAGSMRRWRRSTGR